MHPNNRTKRVHIPLTVAQWRAIHRYAARSNLHASKLLLALVQPAVEEIVHGRDPLGLIRAAGKAACPSTLGLKPIHKRYAPADRRDPPD